MRKNSHTAGAVCVRRADLRGLRLDKTAMLAVDKALGHESIARTVITTANRVKGDE